MKKIMLSLLVSLIGLTSIAQTNFRKITFAEGIEAAKKEGKLVFVDFHTSWCGPCKRMAKEVFPTKQVGDYMNSHFVCLAIDAEKGEGVELAKTYKIKAYPTMTVIRTDKSEAGNVVGYHEPSQLVNELERMINPNMSPEAIKARYGKGERTPELINAYAALISDEGYKSNDHEKYMKAIEESQNIVDTYFAKLSTKQKLSLDNKFVYLTYAKNVCGPEMQFLIHNIDKMDASFKTEADSIVKTNYKNNVLEAVCSDNCSATKLDSLINDVNFLKLNQDGKYNLPFEMVRTYAKGDINAYIEFAHNNFTKLDPDMRTAYAESFADLFKDCDEATKKRAAWIVRDGLSILAPNTLYFASMQLRQLEGGSGYVDPVRP